MALIQVDLPDELNKQIRKTAIDLNFGNRESTVLYILENYYGNK